MKRITQRRKFPNAHKFIWNFFTENVKADENGTKISRDLKNANKGVHEVDRKALFLMSDVNVHL